MRDKEGIEIVGGYDVALPHMMKVRQHFKREELADIEASVRSQMRSLGAGDKYSQKRIAIAVGSRGVANLALVVRGVVSELLRWGAKPFIVPAMGSHGGATADGQKELLAAYGVTEEGVGAPVLSSMDVVQVATLPNGMPLHMDKLAYGADGIVVINRVKPHTDFRADHESGLLKMLGIGLGKHEGAATVHSYGWHLFHRLIPEIGEEILKRTPVEFGVALVENAFEETAKVKVIPKAEIVSSEKQLLEEAKTNMPSLLVSEIDVLIVDEIGKDISGEGMDPNITGRTGSGLAGFSAPPIQRIVVLDLSERTKGSAVGLGLADVTTRRCVEKIDLAPTYANCITAMVMEPAKIPMTINTDREALVVALKTCTRVEPSAAKIVRIKNTLSLEHVEVSTAYREEMESSPDLEAISDPLPIPFDSKGFLRSACGAA